MEHSQVFIVVSFIIYISQLEIWNAEKATSKARFNFGLKKEKKKKFCFTNLLSISDLSLKSHLFYKPSFKISA